MYCWRGALVHLIIILTQPTYLSLRYLLNHAYFSSTATSWLAIGAIVWIYLLTKVTIPFFTSPLHGLPTPPGERFPLGHLDLNGGKIPTESLEKLIERTPNDGLILIWGPLYLYCQVLPTRPDTLMEVLNTNNYDWEKLAASKRLLSLVTGRGLINVEGSEHKAMRKTVTPAFSGHQVRLLVPLFYNKGRALVESMARELRSKSDRVVEIMPQMSRITLDIIGAAGVGNDFNTIENDKDPLANLYNTILDANRGHLLLYFIVNSTFPPWIVRYFTWTRYAKLADGHMQLHKDARVLMQEKKQSMLDKPEQQNDIIATILKSGEFSNDYLVGQLLTFLAAGHDTTASALTWATWLLATHPETQDRLRAECNKHLANKPTSDIDASLFDTEHMPYLAAVCNETLRLYPTVPVTERHSARTTKIGTQVIPKNTLLLLTMWAINRRKDFWGDDADKFTPERWIEGQHKATGGAASPYAFLTFLHGPRSCIGQMFARTEMKCLLASLVMRFRFEPSVPDQKAEIVGFVTIKPHDGMLLKVYDLHEDESSEKQPEQV